MPRLEEIGAAAVLGLLVACARMGEPPGGPPDANPPQLVSTFPDSLRVIPNFKGDVEFRFNEIVSEGSAPNFGLGTGDLEKLIILSPTTQVPSISWKKTRIAVRPREGWQPNRVYRIELLPGLVDLRNNRSTIARTVTFTTGAPIPVRFIQGRVVDWSTSRPEVRALVEAALLPDTLRYRTLADSTGKFKLGPLPEGSYLVAGILDQNRNNKRDGRESFDTVTAAAGRDSVGELWAFKHDTVAARIQTIAANDSISVAVQFNQQLNPFQLISADSVRVRRLPDSTDLGVEAVLSKERYDSVFAPKPKNAADSAAADSARIKVRADSVRADSVARADSVRRARQAEFAPGGRRRNEIQPRAQENAPLKTKPPLSDRLLIRLKGALVPGTKYLVQMLGVQNVSGVKGKAVLGFEVPVVKVDSAKADSTKPDSAAARPDTGRLKRPPGGRP